MHKQEGNRKKHQRVRCPICKAISKIEKEILNGYQFRVCRNGHEFQYDYVREALRQKQSNAKIKF